MRLPRTILAGTLICLAALSAAGWLLSACGEDPLRKAYADYSARVEPLLEKESAIYERLSSMLQERSVGDPALPAYYEFLEEDARPFYSELLAACGEIEPGHPGLDAAHQELLAMAQARFEFVTLELQARGINVRARDTESGLVDLETAQDRGEEAKLDYLRALAGDVPDSRHTRLAQLVIDFQEYQLGPFASGAKSADELRSYIRREVLPRVDEWASGRLPDGETGRLLQVELRAWEDYFKIFATRAPLFQEVLLAAQKSTSAAKAGEKARQAFLRDLEDVRQRK